MINVQSIKDIENKTITMQTTFEADRQAVWDAYTNSTSLDQWWGPQGWPASTKSFEFRDGGHWHYKMTGPDGIESWAWVDYINVEPISSITATDSFSDETGVKDSDLPLTNWKVDFVDDGQGKTTLITKLTLSSEADLQKLIDMGFEAGYTQTQQNLEKYLAGETVYEA